MDAVTGKPIEASVLCMQWNTSGFLAIDRGICAALFETKADSKGYYYIPSQKYNRSFWYEAAYPEDVMIYKDGYSVYKVSGDDLKPLGRSFASGAKDQPYRKKRNLVWLFPFKESDSHHDHLQWIMSFGIYNWPEQFLEKELQKGIERAGQEKYIF